jgi:hydroxymethylbilane synthase
MATRLERASDFDAIVVAAVAFQRLGWDERLTEVLDATVMVPQVAQGALVVECRADDDATRELLAATEHAPSRRAVDVERGFLAELGGDCDLPAGAHAVVDEDGAVTVDALLASLDGHVVLRHRTSGDATADAASIGAEAASWLLANGGASLLDR